MYDINISATSIPSDIHLISSAPMFTLHQQDQQFYEQMFESLADVIGYQPEEHHQPQHLKQQDHYNVNQSCRSIHHQKLRNTKSTTLATSCNQHHLIQHYKQQSLRAQQSRLYNNYDNNEQQSQYNQLHPIAKYNQQKQQRTLANTSPYCPQLQQHCLTIEELKLTRNSCWLCGCNWREGHVSLDCPECDGYALSRPCPSCDGKCKQVWQRNISATHDKHRALWTGHCAFETSVAEVDESEENSSSMGNNIQCQKLDPANPSEQNGTSTAEQQQQPTATHQRGTSQLNNDGTPVSRLTSNNFNNGSNTTTTTTRPTVAVGSQFHLLAPSSSSVCSSQPSSVASSDDEPDDFLSI